MNFSTVFIGILSLISSLHIANCFLTISPHTIVSTRNKLPIHDKENLNSAIKKSPIQILVLLVCENDDIIPDQVKLNLDISLPLDNLIEKNVHVRTCNKTIKSIEVTLNNKNGPLRIKPRRYRKSNVEQILDHETSLLGSSKKFQINQSTDNELNDGLISDSLTLLICKANKRVPPSQVEFVGHESLNVKVTETSKIGNEIQIGYIPKVSDHMKKIGCMIGNDVTYHTIRVYHNPTKFIFVPEYVEFVNPGTNISCQALDGYPSPQVKWRLISGPEDGEIYFSIHENILEIKEFTPKESHWIFECESSTVTNLRKEKTRKTVRFIVSDWNVPYYALVLIVAGFVTTLVSIVIGVNCYYKRKSSKNVTVFGLELKT